MATVDLLHDVRGIVAQKLTNRTRQSNFRLGGLEIWNGLRQKGYLG
jgi:hypothetical protein